MLINNCMKGEMYSWSQQSNKVHAAFLHRTYHTIFKSPFVDHFISTCPLALSSSLCLYPIQRTKRIREGWYMAPWAYMVQRLGRVGDELAESYPSRPAPRRVRVTSRSTQLRGVDSVENQSWLGRLGIMTMILWLIAIQYENNLSLIHIWRCRRSTLCRSRWSPYH